MSSCEAELIAATTAVSEALLIRHMLEELQDEAVMELHIDSTACEGLLYREGPGRARHLTVRQLWLQSELREKRLTVKHVSTTENVSDILSS